MESSTDEEKSGWCCGGKSRRRQSDADDGVAENKGCCKCGKKLDDDDDDDDGCCDEDCCYRTCAGGRITCSLEAGFAGPFAFMSFAAAMYATFSCDYVRITGHTYYDENCTEACNWYISSGMNRGMFVGEVVASPRRVCLSFLSANDIEGSAELFVIDGWWYASMGCALAAAFFGFAALMQILFVSCVPRKAQRYAARCASVLCVMAAILQALTLLYFKGSAIDVDPNANFPHEDVDYTSETLDVSAWVCIASSAAWFITAFILCFLKDPDERDRILGRAVRGEDGATPMSDGKSSSHAFRAAELGDSELRSEEEKDDSDDEEARAAMTVPPPASPKEAAGESSGDEMATFSDAMEGNVERNENNKDHNGFETPFSSEHGSAHSRQSDWDYYGKSTEDFVDG
uniref:Transmembrane protein n=1 Tax=Pseudictyota dubia TaxID=2749911 RepID=A0A7R9ZJU4_9STRA|mmetsp:Transcript_9659/g.18266  ORF Transcript_9659/g.18266 Transcript_9659/m.18266 type:complete len:402 (+) Transcript_9659:40-1245(+)